MGHTNRSPNDYGWILSYRGAASGLKILIFLVSDAYTIMYDGCSKMKIDYGRIRKRIPQLSHKENSFISCCINDAVASADGFTDTVCSVVTYSDYVYVTYTDTMFGIISGRNTGNYFLFSTDTVLRLPTVNAVKLYMIMRRYYNMIGFAVLYDSVVRKAFASSATRSDSVRRSVRIANGHLRIAGVKYSLEKRENVWRFVQ